MVPSPVAGTAEQPLRLPPLRSLGQNVEAMQLVTATRGDERFTLEVRLSINEDRLLLAATDLTGRRVMTLRWSDTAITFDRVEGTPDAIRPEAMVADLVLLYWPEAEVRAVIEPDGEVIDGPYSRVVRRGGREVLRARYDWEPGASWNGVTQYRNAAWDYEIEIQSRELAR